MQITQFQNCCDKVRVHAQKRLHAAFVGISLCSAFLFGVASYQMILSDSTGSGWTATALIFGDLAIAMGLLLSSTQSIQFGAQAAISRDRRDKDTLTGFANRAGLQQRLSELIRSDKPARSSFALLLMDLDRFKEINNNLGHHTGDQLLLHVAARIAESVPDADIRARLGGDEFAVLALNADGRSAMIMARKIQSALETPIVFNDMEIDIHASIGIALFPDHGDNAEAVFRNAEIAMYNAKQGNMALATYTSDLDSHNFRRLALAGELRAAIENRQMVLHFQPKVDLASNRVVGVEALLRWRHPRHGVILPSEFIAIAEQSEIIRTLTYWVIDEALLQCHAWRQMGYTLNIAANLSARNLHDPGLPAKIAGLLAKWAVPADSLTLEITENAIMIDPERALKILMRLHSLGIQISIDDFGTGYSSLVYLKKMPVSQIKMDRSFVSGMLHDDDDDVIVRSTIELGHHMDCQVVAEGVEDEETLVRLKALGCDHIQGYYVSQPLPAGDITAWLRQSGWEISSRPAASRADAPVKARQNARVLPPTFT